MTTIPREWAFWRDDYNADRCVVCGRERACWSAVRVDAEDNARMCENGKTLLPIGRKCAGKVPAPFLVRL